MSMIYIVLALNHTTVLPTKDANSFIERKSPSENPQLPKEK
jgi:hypothetical protein